MSKFSPLTPSPSAAEWDVNVALLPSTVHLSKMFWMVHVVKCLGDAHLWTYEGGAKLSFDGPKVCGGTSLHFMYEHTIKTGGVKVKGEGRN